MKRTRDGGSVTGGTGDIKPQILTMTIPNPGAVDDYAVASINLPVPRFGPSQTRATITEILWIDWFLTGDLDDTACTRWAFLTPSTDRSTGETASATTFLEDLNDPKTFGNVFSHTVITTSGLKRVEGPIHLNLTDSNGNGVLVAADRISAVAAEFGGTGGITATAKVGYRLVNVGIMEYVGIVQSQQAG